MADSKLPALPGHPEPHTMTWTAKELKVIGEYAQLAYEAGRVAGLEEAAAVADRVAKLRASPLVGSIADAIRSLKGPQ